jgi:hypothetical protein
MQVATPLSACGYQNLVGDIELCDYDDYGATSFEMPKNL